MGDLLSDLFDILLLSLYAALVAAIVIYVLLKSGVSICLSTFLPGY